MTNFLHYPQLLAELKLLTLNMFSKVPRVQLKKVMNFTFVKFITSRDLMYSDMA